MGMKSRIPGLGFKPAMPLFKWANYLMSTFYNGGINDIFRMFLWRLTGKTFAKGQCTSSS